MVAVFLTFYPPVEVRQGTMGVVARGRSDSGATKRKDEGGRGRRKEEGGRRLT